MYEQHDYMGGYGGFGPGSGPNLDWFKSIPGMGGPQPTSYTPFSPEYAALVPYVTEGDSRLGMEPRPTGDSAAITAYNAEYSRRAKANRDAISALRTSAAGGSCPDCESLALVYREDARRQSEWLSANPHLAMTASFAPTPTVPATCDACAAGAQPQQAPAPTQAPAPAPARAPWYVPLGFGPYTAIVAGVIGVLVYFFFSPISALIGAAAATGVLFWSRKIGRIA